MGLFSFSSLVRGNIEAKVLAMGVVANIIRSNLKTKDFFNHDSRPGFKEHNCRCNCDPIMKVVITGGLGFIGQLLAGEILAAGELTDSNGIRFPYLARLSVDRGSDSTHSTFVLI